MLSVVGGRCVTRNNEKHIYERKDINDPDDVMRLKDVSSLYPSGMARIEGLLQGPPKVITNVTKEFLDKCDGHIVKIKLLNIGKNRDMLLLSEINEETVVRNFTNDMIDQFIVLDKTSLEDAITFQDISYEIINGYYWDEGFNTNIVTVINELFEIRKQYKKDDNPIEIVFKLILNNAYSFHLLHLFSFQTPILNENKLYQ